MKLQLNKIRNLKKWQIVVAVVVILAVIGARGGNNQASVDGGASTNAPSTVVEDKPDLSELEGMTLADAMAKIDEMNANVTYMFRGDNGQDQEIGDDPTAFIGQGEEQYWVVAFVDGQKVYIDTPGHLENMKQAEQNKDELEAKLPKTDAWIAVSNYADEMYPYGAKIHYILNEIAAEPVDASTWYLKSTIDVTNAYGATQKGLTVEATVTGTKDAPVVESFNVY